MKKTELKSFDITTYDVEIEYSKKIAPIQKKIEKLDNAHENKSLKAHKDFLNKEKESKGSIKTLDEKLVLKEQRIEKANENKLIKLRRKETALQNEFNEYKSDATANTNLEIDRINEDTNSLKELELDDVNAIKSKYSQNVTSYVERLEIYNNNFTNNKNTFQDHYAKYNRLLDENLLRIAEVKKADEEIINKLLSEYIESKDEENKLQKETSKEFEHSLNSKLIHLRRENNVNRNEIKALVSDLKVSFEVHYKNYISKLEDDVRRLSTSYELRKLLIQKDLEINNQKLQNQIDALEQKKNKKTIKSINMKKDLFNVRAEAVKEYEETLLKQKVSIIEKEIEYYKNTFKAEISNLDKLSKHMMNDQDMIKNTSEYFKKLNIDLSGELNKSEQSNNDYLVKHEKLKAEFLQNYIKQFNDIKKRLIESNKKQIERLKTINNELDDIDKFLDTVEPLKEIELNHLRESIEVSEIHERYNIKYAKQDHEIKILQNLSRKDTSIQEIATKDLISDNNKNITVVKSKEVMEKLIAKAKLKYDKAHEINKLRKNSIKLERSILKSSYETELLKTDHLKELSIHENEKDNILRIKDLETQMSNNKQESNYKAEVINKQLEEDLLNYQEKIRAIEFEKDSFRTSVEQIVKEEEHKTDKEIVLLNTEMDNKLTLIEEALNREIKEPSLNIARGEVIIKERISKFDTNDEFYTEFIDSTKELMHSDNLTPDQIKQLVTKNKSVYDKSYKYIDNTYEVLIDAIKFMNDLENRSLLNQVSSTADQMKTKKLQKQIQKLTQDTQKQLDAIKTSKKDHKSKIKSNIQTSITAIGKQKNITEDTLKEQINNMYTNTFTVLSNLQANIKSEVDKLYLPLTKNDQDLLDNAHKNSKKAKAQVEKLREEKINPINIRLTEYITEKEAEKHKRLSEYEAQIKEIKDQVNNIKNNALEDVKSVTKLQTDILSELEKQLEAIKQQKAPLIEERIKEISQSKLELETDYYDRLKALDAKDDESQKIFEYEERIYNIALENAESRYNDTVQKADIAHQKKLVENKENVEIIKKQTERNEERIHKELVDSTNEFEKNIFTVRPKYEESIGDAQKAIDEEQEIKIARRTELIELNRKTTDSIEQALFSSFKEAYDKLQDNLDYYIEKYKIIEEEYFNQNKEATEVIISLQNDCKTKLFNDYLSKHNKTKEDSNKINETLT